MLVIASTNGRVGIKEAVEVLRRGGSALDAVEAGIRPVERNPDDHSVGLGGLPNLLGQVELDASIMDGHTRAAGAVGALRGYVHAITLARRVMERLPHVFLVGDGAARFAAETGMQPEELLTPEARVQWEARLRQVPAGTATPEPGLERYYARMAQLIAEEPTALQGLAAQAQLAADPERSSETVNFIAQDSRGHIACGVSTSGWAWKYPGRLGDSPVIGAGNYADDRYGAAACTGRGELAIRACTAYATVAALRAGASVEEACQIALGETLSLDDPYAGAFGLIALDRRGRAAAASNRPGATYLVMTPDMREPEERPRLVVSSGQPRRKP